MSVTQRDTDVYICYFCKISHDLISSSLVQFFFFGGGGNNCISDNFVYSLWWFSLCDHTNQ